MKNITVQDGDALVEKFGNFCNTAEQDKFPILMIIYLKLNRTMLYIHASQKVNNQEEIRALFRVVLMLMDEDFTDYLDE